MKKLALWSAVFAVAATFAGYQALTYVLIGLALGSFIIAVITEPEGKLSEVSNDDALKPEACPVATPRSLKASGRAYKGAGVSFSPLTPAQQRRHNQREEKRRKQYDRAGAPPHGAVITGLAVLACLCLISLAFGWSSVAFFSFVFLTGD